MHEIRRHRRRRGGDARRRANPMLCRRDDLEISTLLGKSSHGSVEASPARLRARRVRGGLVGDAARAGGGAARAECDRGRREARSRGGADGGEEVLPALLPRRQHQGRHRLLLDCRHRGALLGLRPDDRQLGLRRRHGGQCHPHRLRRSRHRRLDEHVRRAPSPLRTAAAAAVPLPTAATAAAPAALPPPPPHAAAAARAPPPPAPRADARTDPCAAATSSAWPRRT